MSNYSGLTSGRNRRKVIVVLGARSGTSALAGTLGILGCALPKNLMAANSANLRGYFEPQDIADIHDEILKSVGTIWSDSREFPSSWFHSPEASQYRQRLAATFEEDIGDAALSVLKEPRMCRLIPLWDSIFDDLKIDPVFCFIDRNPLEIAASLHSRDGSSLTHGLRYYLRNHLDAEHATRNRTRAFVSYHDFVRDWRTVIASITAKLDVQFPGIDAHQTEVDSFLDPGLRHQVSKTIQYPLDLLRVMADTVHVIFGDLSVGRSELVAYSRLDRLRATFNKLQQQ